MIQDRAIVAMEYYVIYQMMSFLMTLNEMFTSPSVWCWSASSKCFIIKRFYEIVSV